MASPNLEFTPNHPFTSYKFAVEIAVDGMEGLLYAGAFAECDGLEMTMEIKTIREGGNNGMQIRLPGPLSYGQLILKRGMTANFGLWDWFNTLLQPRKANTRANAEVVLFAPDQSERVRFLLTNCLPVKLKAPPLNAKDGILAIEEMQIAYETLTLKQPSSGNTPR